MYKIQIIFLVILLVKMTKKILEWLVFLYYNLFKWGFLEENDGTG